MNLKFIVILFVLSVTSCRCGLLNLFNRWTDELDPKNSKTKCREKREAEENGIKPDITMSTADKPVSLMDFAEGELTAKSEQNSKTETHQGNLKRKRCSKNGYVVSAYNPVVGGARKSLKLLPLVKRDSASEEQCNACTNGASCKLLGQCVQCNEKCKGIAIYTDDILRPWTNQSVGMAHRIAPNKNDVFSKTLYPVSTYRDGETKDIICRIVGITDTSDIETVTIWVTTHSNTPPKLLNGRSGDFTKLPRKIENTMKQNLKELLEKRTNPNNMPNIISPSLSELPMVKGPATLPNIQARFNDYDDENGSTFSRFRNNGMEKIKANPDVIEGPPPFVGSNNLVSSKSPNIENSNDDDKARIFNKPIIVQPKEFELDDSDEDDTNNDTSPSSGVSSLPPIDEPTTSKIVIKPALLSKLRELARTNKLTGLKDRRQKIDNGSPAKEGFIKNLLKSRQNAIEENSKIQKPLTPNFLQDASQNMEHVRANENQNPSIRLPSESDDQIAKINDAIQEVKSMVENIQKEASKASEKRILGASHIADTSEDLAQNNIGTANMPSLPTNQIPQMLPNHVAENLKKVNNFLINRAQDALDMIEPKRKSNQPLPPAEVGSNRDEHSEITQDTIANFKKMPQFLLEKFKDTLNGFENQPRGSPAINVDSNGVTGEATKENIELTERFDGNDGTRETNTHMKVGSIGVGSDDDPIEAVVGQPEQNILENITSLNDETSPKLETRPNVETATTKTYKNKLEKYIAELKEKRQKIYSPDMFLKNSSPKASKMDSLLIKQEEPARFTEPFTFQNVIPIQGENNSGKAVTSSVGRSANELEKQRELLHQKLKQFMSDIKLKASTSIPLTTIDKKTPTSLQKNIELATTDNQDQNNFIKSIVKPQSSSDLTQSAFEETPDTKVEPSDRYLPQNFPQYVPTDQVVGESQPNNRQEVNKIYDFLPTNPTLPSNEVNPNSETSNKLRKYLDDLKGKQSSLLKPKSDNSVTQDQYQVPETENELQDKKNSLKAKIKSYVDNLNKPVEETVGQPEMPLNERMSDQISNLNNKIKNDMKNFLEPTTGIFKKDKLKEKLRNYVESVRKPMGSKMVPDFVRKTSEVQRKELSFLRKKLESLLKAKEPIPFADWEETPLVSKTEPKVEPSISEKPLVDQNMIPIISNRANAINGQTNNIVGDIQNSARDTQFEQTIDKTLLNTPPMDNQDLNLQEGADNLDWSHSLGKIVQSSSKPKDIFFFGSGIKLPLKLTEGPNGSMDLSVDLEKLCSCYNATCSKNHTAIEETVGAILEKEAELNEQLKSDAIDDVKEDPIVGSPIITKPEKASINKEPTIMQKILSNINAKTIQRRSNIFKRSSDVRGLSQELTTIKTVLEKLKKKNEENIRNNVLKDTDLPKLPSLDMVADELNNLGQKVQNSVTNSVQQLTNRVEELKEELEDKLVGANQNPDIFSNQNFPTLPTYNPDWFQDNLNQIKEHTDEINNDILEKLQHENTIRNLINVNGLQPSHGVNPLNNKYIKSLSPDRMFNSILKTNGINKFGLKTDNPLTILKNQANDVIKNFEEQNTIDKIIEKTRLNTFGLPKISTTKDPLAVFNEFQEKLKDSLPTIPEINNRMNEINNNVVKLTDTYQFGKAKILEKKLKQLDNEVQKYYKSNEKLLSEESKKLLGGHNNEIVEKEVNIINRIISWIESLASGVKQYK